MSTDPAWFNKPPAAMYQEKSSSHTPKLLRSSPLCLSHAPHRVKVQTDRVVAAGTTAGLVSKYRPPVPILTLVVPTLHCKDRLAWTLQGRSVARVCLIQRGILPVLAAPSPSGPSIPASKLPFIFFLQTQAGILKVQAFFISTDWLFAVWMLKPEARLLAS